ncbi:hypothetical protein APHAL10511_007545 [Amanita phalloides]|nr:hypothetical protein APHAL10511_007545 [Amanita phalloides]
MVRCAHIVERSTNSLSTPGAASIINKKIIIKSIRPQASGQFPVPAPSTNPLLAFRCSQTIRPYIAGDGSDPNQPVSILIDAPVVSTHINGIQPITITNPSSPGALNVTVTTTNGLVLAQGSVPVNSNKTELPLCLDRLEPSSSAYDITCTATYNSQTFVTNSLLTYLPAPPQDIGSVTKMDLRTGALLAQPANGRGGPFAPVFPIGFYTQFDSYLDTNLSIPATLASQGFNIIHMVPSFTNTTTLDQVLDQMQEAGLYIIYDMRSTYTNATSVTEQVNSIKSRPNLLLWYTADEPDGTSDPLNATVTASNLITSLDGGDGKGGAGYHPVSLVLNCENYYFTQYTSGADIVLQDAYTVDINATWSTVWHTPCTEDFGDCGCDNCKGSFQDIATRMDEFSQRLFINGWERTKAVWTVPQAFGQAQYWPRDPTGQEFVVQSILGINHGGLGVVSWDDPTTTDIKAYASTLALSLPKMTPYITSPSAAFRQTTINGVDCGLWTVGSQTLVLATNTGYVPQTVTLTNLNLPAGAAITQVLDTGSYLTSAKDGLVFTSVGSGGFIIGFGHRNDGSRYFSSIPFTVSAMEVGDDKTIEGLVYLTVDAQDFELSAERARADGTEIYYDHDAAGVGNTVVERKSRMDLSLSLRLGLETHRSKQTIPGSYALPYKRKTSF